MKNPFSLFDWKRPFLPDVLQYICKHTYNLQEHSVIILPHKRPRRYILDIIRRHEHLARPMLIPHMLTIAELVQHLRPTHEGGLRTASSLDCAHLLYTCVHKAAEEDVPNTYDIDIRQQFSAMDLAHFLPWGTRLARLFEEYMLQSRIVHDIPYTEGEVSDTAAALLSVLGRIYGHYRTLLRERGWTTPGLDALMAAERFAENTAPLPSFLCGHGQNTRHIFVVGFFAPTRTERTLFHRLWQGQEQEHGRMEGAHICIHTDPAILKHEKAGHWSCLDHKQWMKEWRAQGQLITEQATPHRPRYHFMAGYDVHSQLRGVHNLLDTDNESPAPSTALVLTSPDILMPTLHHLPRAQDGSLADFNVSMGYPLDKSSLMALLNAIFEMHLSARVLHVDAAQSKTYYWRHLLHCVQHPYITMLGSQHDETKEKTRSIRQLLYDFEKHLRQGHAYVDPIQLMEHILANAEVCDTTGALFAKIFQHLVSNFTHMTTAQHMCDALTSLCHMLLDDGHGVWERYPLDAESLYRLLIHCIPSLKGSTLANESLPQESLFHITRELLAQERVPFEADPLTGLQILGMLETRLLHFERVIFVDATDDVLPGFSAQDPLLPDALRSGLGLPASHSRERLVAHTFYRLMAAAKDVYFFWQESESTLFDQKKVQSRFVDACLWEEEQARKILLHKGTPPLMAAQCPVRPIVPQSRMLMRNSAIHKRLCAMMQWGISPTQLDSYLHCPQRFAWQYLYRLRPLDSAREGEDIPAVGNLLHTLMERLYTPHRGTQFNKDSLSHTQMQQVYKDCLAQSDLADNIPPDSLLLLHIVTPHRLANYVAEQPKCTHIVDVEKTLQAPLAIFPHDAETTCLLKGKADRIDKRPCALAGGGENTLLILDYKTGKVPRVNKNAWSDAGFFEKLEAWQSSGQTDVGQTGTGQPDTIQANGDALLDIVAENFASLQLPSYLFMAKHSYPTDTVGNAAWIDLGETGSEQYFLDKSVSLEERTEILSMRIPRLLAFVLRHMYSATHFVARSSVRCAYCPFGTLCKA